jgi:glutamine cyclotransferase
VIQPDRKVAPILHSLGTIRLVCSTALCGLVALLVIGGCIFDDEPPNHAPVIESLVAEPAELYPGDTAQVAVVATDRDDDRLSYSWSADCGTILQGAEAAMVSWTAPDSPGICSLAVFVTDGEASVGGDLGIQVLSLPPILSVVPTELDFADALTALSLEIRNLGGSLLAWSAAGDADWLSVFPAADTTGAETDTITVSVERSGLYPGTYAGWINIASSAGDVAVAVSMDVPGTPIYTYVVRDSFPHDRRAFTQGLVYRDGIMYEGTGRFYQSSLRAIELVTGDTLRVHQLYALHFGEGVTLMGDRIIQLTLNAGIGFVYDVDTFELLDQFSYSTQGWGLTHDGSRLIMSDGSSMLYFLDPETFERIGEIQVFDQGEPIDQLNELEYVNGEVYANIWKTERIARVSPGTGEVLGWIDLAGLRARVGYPTVHVDVLNGIAFDAQNDRLFVTGKLWPLIYEIDVYPEQD